MPVLLTDFLPALQWAERHAHAFAAYLSRWLDMLDPGED